MKFKVKGNSDNKFTIKNSSDGGVNWHPALFDHDYPTNNIFLIREEFNKENIKILGTMTVEVEV